MYLPRITNVTALAGVALAISLVAARYHRPAAAVSAVGERVPLSLRLDGVVSRASVRSAFILPGRELRLGATGAGPLRLRDHAGHDHSAPAPADWVWRAPDQPGTHSLVVAAGDGRDSILINVFVLVPFDSVRRGWLNGYRVGEYPATPLRGLDIYRRPLGFVEVTRENQHLAVSPNFRLGQFPAKQTADFPKYVVLDGHLVELLERILEGVRGAGYPAATLSVMSGYRTPHYHRAIGNRTRYSRHLWGAAADIFVDESPRDGTMDDLNGDGMIDERDAWVLARIAEDIMRDPATGPLQGGIGVYRATAAHGPFVHADVRGFRASW